jgi:hypothetical protein
MCVNCMKRYGHETASEQMTFQAAEVIECRKGWLAQQQPDNPSKGLMTQGEEVRISGVGKYQKKQKGKKEHICIKRLWLRFLTTIRHGFLIAERYVKWFDLRATLVYVLFWTGYYERKGEG